MTEQILITGVGLTTPLGLDVEQTWRSLLDGAFVTDQGFVPVARDGTMARVEQLALLAAREAIGTQDVSGIPLFVGTSKGPADQWLFDKQTGLFGLDTLAATLARELCLGDRTTYSAACASGLQALCVAVMRMRHDAIPRAIVVASESSLHRIWSQTFKRLGVLAPPGEPCRPFDDDRRGFVISEAAAAIVLERRVPRVGDIVIVDALFGGDAFHLTGTDPDARLLRHLIARVTGGEPIDFVHAHATATANDDVELRAIERTLGRPVVYSHKGAIGHTLGASGLVAVAISTRIHATNTVPPHATTPRPIASTTATLAGPTAVMDRDVRSSVCLASGFGGATAVVHLRSI